MLALKTRDLRFPAHTGKVNLEISTKRATQLSMKRITDIQVAQALVLSKGNKTSRY